MENIRDAVLAMILGCGINDVKMLEDVKYDVLDVVEEEMQSGESLSFNQLLTDIATRGAETLIEDFVEKKEEIRILLEEEIAAYEWDAKNMGISMDKLMEEEPEYTKLLEDHHRLAFIDPQKDFHVYANCADTRIFLDNYDFYANYMYSDLAAIEDAIGFTSILDSSVRTAGDYIYNEEEREALEMD